MISLATIVINWTPLMAWVLAAIVAICAYLGFFVFGLPSFIANEKYDKYDLKWFSPLHWKCIKILHFYMILAIIVAFWVWKSAKYFMLDDKKPIIEQVERR